jgi:pimeloyl-ACP methyl ester carboxylesterase
MNKVISKDGTAIAYERVGNGPALILVDGALCYRAFGPSGPLAKVLAETFTVYRYDRRGRGESGNNPPYATEREVEDIDALIREAGGPAFVYGISSGAALALEAARLGVPMRKLALYEAPFVADASHPPMADDYLTRLREMVAEDRRTEAVKFFMRRVGVPSIMLAIMPLTPPWKKLKGVAHTLPYDIEIVEPHQRGRELPAGQWSSVTIPTLVMAGSKSPGWMRNGMEQLARVLPHAELRTLEGQTHMVKPKPLAAELTEFFAGQERAVPRSAVQRA